MLKDDGLLRLNGCGHEKPGGDYGFDARLRPERPHVVLQLTINGLGWHERRGTGRTTLRFGHVFFETIPGPFHYGSDDDEYELVFLSLTGKLADRLVSHVARTFGPCFAISEPGGLAADMIALVREYRSGGLRGDAFAVSARLYGIVTAALSRADAARRAGADGDPLVADARRLIERHVVTHGFGVAELAESLGVSREHLTRTFSRRTGTTPAEAITLSRLRLAASLLRSTERSVAEIAERSGFAGANYLCRRFRQRVGVTPADFRRRRWLAGP